MPDGSYRLNHYIPQWYQRNFLPENGEEKFFYLNLFPTFFSRPGHAPSKGREWKKWGTASCFQEKDLYTTFFGDLYSIEIEKYFFGQIDRTSPAAISHLINFEHPNWNSDLIELFFTFLSIQRLRTPKGLAFLKNQLRIDGNGLLFALQRFQQMFCATWSECVWAIASAENSPTGFILTDSPVTVYNRRCPPGSHLCRSHEDPDIRLNGTHTIFALNKNKAMIGTNLSWVRNPFSGEKALRPNPGLYRATVFNMQGIQTNRLLTEREVLEINFILKKRAHSFIAAEKKEWLYPEEHLQDPNWSQLGNGYLLMPDPRSVEFALETVLGYANGRGEVFDVYGRRSSAQDDAAQNAAYRTFQAAQSIFAENVGPRRRGRAFSLGSLEPEVDSSDMHAHYLEFKKYIPKNYRR